MAHYAEISADNIVLRVIVVADQDCSDQDGIENEAIGALFCHRLLGGRWIKTSYNSRIRGKYAGMGDTYDANLDRFIPPQPYPSWTFDGQEWVAPVPMPEGPHRWDEAQLAWVAVDVP